MQAGGCRAEREREHVLHLREEVIALSQIVESLKEETVRMPCRDDDRILTQSTEMRFVGVPMRDIVDWKRQRVNRDDGKRSTYWE